MKSICITLVACALATLTVAQKTHNSYIATDTSMSHAKIVDQGIFRNNRQVKVTKYNISEPLIYFPKDIKEFGFDNTVYESKPVHDEDGDHAYFLLRLSKGRSKLFLLKANGGKRFFGERDTTLLELTKETFRESLATLWNSNDKTEPAIADAKFNKGSLQRIFHFHNKSYSGFFPRFRKGVLFGVSVSSFTVKGESGESVNVGMNWSPFYGAFIDFPLGVSPHWFMHTEVFYQQNRFSYFREVKKVNQDYLVNTSAINVPLLAKYSATSKTARGYFVMGPTLTYYLKNENKLIQAHTDVSNVVEIDKVLLNSISHFQLGASVGLGFEYSIHKRKALGMEARLNRGFGVDGDNKQSVTAFQFSTQAYF